MQQGRTVDTYTVRRFGKCFRRLNITQRPWSFRACCQTTEWRGTIGHCEDFGRCAVYQTKILDRRDDEPGEISGSGSFVQSSACSLEVRWVFETQERNLLSENLGVTVARIEESKLELKAVMGSTPARLGRDGVDLAGFWVRGWGERSMEQPKAIS